MLWPEVAPGLADDRDRDENSFCAGFSSPCDGNPAHNCLRDKKSVPGKAQVSAVAVSRPLGG